MNRRVLAALITLADLHRAEEDPTMELEISAAYGRHGVALRALDPGDEETYHEIVPAGWFDLVLKLTLTIEAELARLPQEIREKVKVAQIKEKFASLRLYIDGPRDVVGLESAIGGHIARAAFRSARTCAVCGEPGHRRQRDGYVYTSCDVHAEAETGP